MRPRGSSITMTSLQKTMSPGCGASLKRGVEKCAAWLVLGAALASGHGAEEPASQPPAIGSAEGPGYVLYAGAAELPTGWTAGAWGGLSTMVDATQKEVADRSSIRLFSKNEETQPWAGATLSAALPANALAFPAAQWSLLALNLHINGGSNLTGQTEGHQPLQIQARFFLTDGSVVEGKYVALDDFITENTIDGDPASWQPVSIPLDEFGIPAARLGAVAGLAGLTFQHASPAAVLSALHFSEISIAPPAAFLTERKNVPVPLANPAAFPALEALPAPLRLAEDQAITVDPQGNFCVDNKPRFILGAQVPEVYQASLSPTAGYPAELKWIYDEPLNFERAQRLGFDSLGYFTSESWQHSAIENTTQPPFGQFERNFLGQFMAGSKLPLYVDFTAAPWSHGKLAAFPNVPPEALNTNGSESESNHWVPYSIIDPRGTRLYHAMWRDGAEHLKASGGKALFYELFNEPAYDDPSAFNRAAFVEMLRRKYVSIEPLNARWRTQYTVFEEIGKFKTRYDQPALFVEWSQFMEDAFVALCRAGRETIRSVDPQARITVQGLSGGIYRSVPWSNVNLYKLIDVVDVASTETRGGIEFAGNGGLEAPPRHSIDTPFISPRFEGMMHRHFMRSIAAGKPIHDGEHYIDGWQIEDSFWLQVARGGNGAYIFKWDKRAWDPLWGADKGPLGGRELMRKMPYCVLNPYSVAPAKLPEILSFKKELTALDDLFVPRQNYRSGTVALLLSYPTERYGHAIRSVTQHLFRSYGVALDFSHFPFDVLLEEQLSARLDSYKVLVAAGVSNLLPGTAPQLKAWIEAGGTLIMGIEAMRMDEYGNPLDQSEWLGPALGDVLPANAAPQPFACSVRDAALPGEILARPYRAIAPQADWEIAGSFPDQPALLKRSFGKGRIWFINAKLSDYGCASVLGGILAGIARQADLLRTDNQEREVNTEVRKFQAGKLTGWFLYNWDRYPKDFTFSAPELNTAEDQWLVDPLGKKRYSLKDNHATVHLDKIGKRLLILGPREALAARFGPLPEP
jgi:Beta-galactosidase